jgi:hypothetical protein
MAVFMYVSFIDASFFVKALSCSIWRMTKCWTRDPVGSDTNRRIWLNLYSHMHKHHLYKYALTLVS